MVLKNKSDQTDKLATAVEAPKRTMADENAAVVNADLNFILQQISNYSDALHKKNQKRIKAGLWCIAIIPLFFLFLLFKMDSSKIVYLLLWVISLFIISVYLIAVEYSDYTMQERLKTLSANISTNNDALNYDTSALIESNLPNLLQATKEIKL